MRRPDEFQVSKTTSTIFRFFITLDEQQNNIKKIRVCRHTFQLDTVFNSQKNSEILNRNHKPFIFEIQNCTISTNIQYYSLTVIQLTWLYFQLVNDRRLRICAIGPWHTPTIYLENQFVNSLQKLNLTKYIPLTKY